MCKLKLGVGTQPLIVKSKIGIVFEVEFLTLFRHSRKTFPKHLELRKVGKSRKISSPKIHLRFRASNYKLWTNLREVGRIFF